MLMQSKRIAISVAAAAMILAPLTAKAAQGRDKNPFQGIPVSSTSGSANAFKGTMDVLGFTSDGAGGVFAIASLTGTLTNAAGVAQQVAGAVAVVPVNTAASGTARGFGGTATQALAPAAAAASCAILHLDLGPLHLTLLGLNVDLNEVVLDITATPGPGNLLGNLLCAITNLLNGINLNAILGNALATLLNNLLLALGL